VAADLALAVRDAGDVGLRYVSADDPGIARERRGKGFTYTLPSHEPVTDAATLARIRALAIPPAWTAVWISAQASGHIQATGRDARGRKQYRYHIRFRDRRDADKFDRMVRFGELLPRIRRRVTRDLRARGLPRDKVLAAVVRLLELTLLRVGNDEYARLNQTFGLSTLRNRHAQIRGENVRFRFRGKGGKVHEVGVSDRRLAALVRRCQGLPGQQLFEYLDESGETRQIDSENVNEYIRRVAGDDSFSAKDVRTWSATVLAYRALQATEAPARPTEARRVVASAIQATAERLGNTPTVARESYVHPAILESYLEEGEAAGRAEKEADRAPASLSQAAPASTATAPSADAPRRRRVSPEAPPTPAEEAAVLELLRARAADARASKRETAKHIAAAVEQIGSRPAKAAAATPGSGLAEPAGPRGARDGGRGTPESGS
jgi:DNA topoisomerase I